MLSTPATRLERLSLLLSLLTPLLSLTTSSQRQAGGAPPQHTHTCVATCKPRISFQRKFIISIKFSFQVFPPPPISGLSVFSGRDPLQDPPRADLNLPLRVQGLKTYNSARNFVFPPHSIRQQEDFLFTLPRIQLSQYTPNTGLTVQLQQNLFMLTNQQHYRTASGFLKIFLLFTNQQHYRTASGFLKTFFFIVHKPTALLHSFWFSTIFLTNISQ